MLVSANRALPDAHTLAAEQHMSLSKAKISTVELSEARSTEHRLHVECMNVHFTTAVPTAGFDFGCNIMECAQMIFLLQHLLAS